MHRRSSSTTPPAGAGVTDGMQVVANVPRTLIVPPNLADFETVLKRHVGGFSKWKAFLYAKRGFYLEEYNERDKGAGAVPLAVRDLTHAIIINKENCANEEFCMRFINGEELRLLAPTVAERNRWVTVLRTIHPGEDDVDTTPSFPAALIAPIRRRHTSMSLPRKGSKDAAAMQESRAARASAVRRDEPFKVIATLRVHVMEGSNIGLNASTKPSPYAVILVDGINRATTLPKHASTNPFWAHEFFFDSEITHETSSLVLLINNVSDRKNKRDTDCRLGVVEVDLNMFRHGRAIDQWFVVRAHERLQPNRSMLKRKLNSSHGDGSIGKSRSTTVEGNVSTAVDEGFGLLRLKLTLTLEKIMPFSEYRQLLDIIIDPELTVAEAIAKVAIAQLDEAAGTLVNIFALNNRVTNFVRTLTTLEIRKTDRAAIIFRGNTLGTKVIDMYMKMVGLEYLHETLASFVRSVAVERDSLEIDPTRLEKGEDAKKNQKRLYQYCDSCFKAIQYSVDNCPPEIKRVFANIREEVIRKFKTGDEQYTAVSGFIFLRFFCPAILNPALFGLVNEPLTTRPARSLTLVAKVIQCLANLVPVIDKEPYMAAMLPFMEERQEAMRQLIAQFSMPAPNDTFEQHHINTALDDRDLSRELSALQRLCVEKFAELKTISDQSTDDNLRAVFPVLTRLEQRQFDYERQYAREFAEKLAAAQAAAANKASNGGTLSHPRLARIIEHSVA